MFFKFLLLVLSIELSLLENASAAYDDYSTCTFYKPGIPACSGRGTSDVSDLVGYFLNGAENYALIKHPYGIYIFVNVDNVWMPSAASDLFINGVYAIVVKVNGVYYYIPEVGCSQPAVLTYSNRLVDGSKTITFAKLLTAIQQEDKYCSYDIPCNVLPYRKLIGPYPGQQNFVTGGNVLIHTTSLQSAIFTAQNSTGYYQLAKELTSLAQENKLNLTIKSGGKNEHIVTENRSPRAPSCVVQNYNLFPSVKDFSPITCMQPNSICYLATLIAQELARPSCYNTFLVYVNIVIFERYNRGTVFIPGYLTNEIFVALLDAILVDC